MFQNLLEEFVLLALLFFFLSLDHLLGENALSGEGLLLELLLLRGRRIELRGGHDLKVEFFLSDA